MESFRKRRTDPHTYTAFDATGKLLGRLVLPADSPAIAFTAGGVLLWRTDKDGAEHLVVYELVKPLSLAFEAAPRVGAPCAALAGELWWKLRRIARPCVRRAPSPPPAQREECSTSAILVSGGADRQNHRLRMLK